MRNTILAYPAGMSRKSSPKFSNEISEREMCLLHLLAFIHTNAKPSASTGLPPTGTKKIPNFSLAVTQFSLTLQDDYSGNESTKIRMAQIIFKTKLPCLCKNISYNNLRQPNIPKMTKRSSAKSMFFSESNPSHALF